MRQDFVIAAITIIILLILSFLYSLGREVRRDAYRAMVRGGPQGLLVGFYKKIYPTKKTEYFMHGAKVPSEYDRFFRSDTKKMREMGFKIESAYLDEYGLVLSGDAFERKLNDYHEAMHAWQETNQGKPDERVRPEAPYHCIKCWYEPTELQLTSLRVRDWK
ncbi:MAG: hypothetical protein WC444_03505 [Candidatus Paceibacterota bacterium]